MDIAREDIALRLVEERGRIGYSQRDFAAKVGISTEGLRRYETGQHGISGEFLAKAAAFGIDIQYVLIGIRAQKVEESVHTPPPVAIHPGGNVVNITGGSNILANAHPGSNVTQIHTQRHVSVTKAEVKPGIDHITDAQAAILMGLVNDIVELEAKQKKEPKTHRSVWGTLNAHMGVTRYRLIPLLGFEKAEKYLRQWIGRLNSMATAPVNDGDGWRKRHYAYIKINSKDDPTVVDRYIARMYKASSLTELSNGIS
jgi:hypothetical protein